MCCLQLRALYHVYLQLGIRFLKLLPDAQKQGVGKFLQPYILWATDDPPADPNTWRLSMLVDVAIESIDIGIKGKQSAEPGAGSPPPNLAYLTLQRVAVARMTNEVPTFTPNLRSTF